MAKVKMSDSDKLKKELISQFNKDFPDSPLEQMDESALADVPGWMTTGNYALNWIVSRDMYKGLPMGRVILLTGDAGSGKSMIALSMMREEDIDLIVYMDSEGGGITSDFADFLKIDTSSIPSSVPRFLEYCLSNALFQCSITPKLVNGVPSFSGS